MVLIHKYAKTLFLGKKLKKGKLNKRSQTRSQKYQMPPLILIL